MRIELSCLGVFRELGDSVVIDVQGASVEHVRTALKAHLSSQNQSGLAAIVERSVFAAGDTLLQDGESIPEGALAILPPVAGG